MQIVGAMRTDRGLVREANEDAVAWITPQDETVARSHGSLAIVADGMGGHAAGEIASAIAVEVIQRVYYDLKAPTPKVLEAAFNLANSAILKYADQHPECRGMGTTCTVLAFWDGKAWLGHIGDSRAYLLHKGELRQLSEDQTLVAQLVSEGAITREEADSSPVQNVILQALGARAEIAPIIGPNGLALEPGDVLVLCSDGVFNMIAEPMIADVAGRLPPQEACDALIEAVLAAGGHDNASLGIFSVNVDSAAKKPLEPTTRRINLPIEQRR